MNISRSNLKTLALSELRRVAERTRMVPAEGRSKREEVRSKRDDVRGISNARPSTFDPRPSESECIERVPWRVWYVAASNGDCIRGELCITLAVYPDAGACGARLVQFVQSGQTRRLRDCCILQADDFMLRV